MFRNGDFKIVKINNGNWELYNIKKDPTELDNLAKKHPGKVKELAHLYNLYNEKFKATDSK